MKTLRAVGLLSAAPLCALALVLTSGADAGDDRDANTQLIAKMYEEAVNG